MVIDTITSLIQAQPIISLIIISIIVTFFMTLVTWLVTDNEKMKDLRGRQKELQKQAREHQKNGNTDALLEVNKQIMMGMPEMMRHSFKPMLITFIPAIFIFSFLNATYKPILTGWWILYYIIVSIAASTVLRKLFKMA
jgi:uncharacterized membrane protein (DUF106 family)